MDHNLELQRGEKITIHGNGIVLSLSLGDDNGIYSQMASEIGAQRIVIRQHREDHRTLIFRSEENLK